jgi:protein SCO1/2
MGEAAMRTPKLCLYAALLCAFMMACQRTPEKRYELKGKVIAVDKAQRQVTIEHEQIKGFMDAMTMPFTVKEDWALSALAAGQSIEATLVVQGDRSWIEGIRLSQGDPITGSESTGSMPAIGESVPDFRLLNQDNKPIRLAQYRGRNLLLTFIYTRCPIPEFCPRTSMKFSEVYKGLKPIGSNAPAPHLLTVSFDPEHDKPEVLREYAGRFMRPPDFAQWEFATGSEDQIKEITGYFGLTYRPESGQITHNLVTALIGPDGKLKKLFQGKDWTPAQVLAEFR